MKPRVKPHKTIKTAEVIFAAVVFVSVAAPADSLDAADPAQWVDPFIGTAWTGKIGRAHV